MVPAKRGKQTVSGTITWSVAINRVDDSDPSDPSRKAMADTTQEQHRLRIALVRDPKFTRTYVFKRAKAEYNYTFDQTRVTDDFTMGQHSCTTTTVENAGGSGTTDLTASIFGKYHPDKDVLVIDKRTKGISIGAILEATGSSTTTMTGFGSSPCQEGTFTDPVTTNGSTGLNDANNMCLPDKLKAPRGYRPLFGKWNKSKKRFDFACSDSFTDGPETTAIRVSGSLKYKKSGK